MDAWAQETKQTVWEKCGRQRIIGDGFFSALGMGQENTLSSKVKESQMANLHSDAASTEKWMLMEQFLPILS